MACAHYNIGCERPFVEPLIRHINSVEGTDYEHYQCLDHGSNDSQTAPQPEALYIGAKSGLLTVERKRLEWPPGKIERHRFWHKLADRLHQDLAPLTDDAPYKLQLPMELPIKNRHLQDTQTAIVEAIRCNIEEVRQGHPLRVKEPVPFEFRLQDARERCLEDPKRGLLIQTSERSSLLGRISLDDQKGVLDTVQRYLQVCATKFSIWSNTRRILLLEPHGEIARDTLYFASWDELVTGEVDEVWEGAYYQDPLVNSWFDEWHFERLYPKPESP